MRSFIITGSKKKRNEFIQSFIAEEEILPHAVTEYSEDIKIKKAKEIRMNLLQKHSEKRLIVINSPINLPSQNALLKSFEELPNMVSVIISLDTLNGVLQTMRSRFFLKHFLDELSVEGQEVQLAYDDVGRRILAADSFLTALEVDAKSVIDEFIKYYRRDFLKTIAEKDEKMIRLHLSILKNLIKTSQLVKFNNVNLRLGVEASILPKAIFK